MTVPSTPPFLLASGSAARRRLLEEAGYIFDVKVSGATEPPPERFASALAYVQHTAWLKASTVAHDSAGRWVLAADTVATIGGLVVGKPAHREDAERILRTLQGTRHQTTTGVCLHAPGKDLWFGLHETTTVLMRPLDDATIDGYLDSGRWAGKAGAYGMQDKDDPFVEALEGSVSNVIGLPMERLGELFELVSRLHDVQG
ncbi:Maf-like protein YhdE [Planctomycetes bacterium Pan216]|uniref:Nucleoside triphosphate pyrophosphatase n=1 Tax=Kolteria novifilia TaxID=2527975 RepID=A0A518AXI3_9BACT|nr:Maf-like protein YhdE [Planctomycetes bacterium Pan216]